MIVVIDVMRCVNWVGGQACGSNSRGSTNAVCHLGLIAFAVCINLLGRVSLAARAVDDVFVYKRDDYPRGDWDERLRDLTW